MRTVRNERADGDSEEHTMSASIAAPAHAAPDASGGKNYLNAEKGVWSWLTTVDHKRIGIMYLVTVMAAFGLGGFFALLLRLKL